MAVSEPYSLVTCIECGAQSDLEATGWRAYLIESEEDSSPDELVLYCPACAAGEFG